MFAQTSNDTVFDDTTDKCVPSGVGLIVCLLSHDTSSITKERAADKEEEDTTKHKEEQTSLMSFRS